MITMFIQTGLLIWFILSLFLVAFDKTFSFNMKILGEIINILSLSIIAINLFNINIKSFQIGYFITVGLLLIWYLYFTSIDIANPGYTQIEKIIYGTIDISMIIYLSSCLLTKQFYPQLVHYSYLSQIYQLKTFSFFWI